jgi:hypothetical protein
MTLASFQRQSRPPAEAIEPGRCPAMIRTPRGYETCHLAEHGPEIRHHVRDRSWLTGKPTPCLKLGQPCTDACAWPDRVTPYLGYPPGAVTAPGAPTRARRRAS